MRPQALFPCWTTAEHSLGVLLQPVPSLCGQLRQVELKGPQCPQARKGVAKGGVDLQTHRHTTPPALTCQLREAELENLCLAPPHPHLC